MTTKLPTFGPVEPIAMCGECQSLLYAHSEPTDCSKNKKKKHDRCPLNLIRTSWVPQCFEEAARKIWRDPPKAIGGSA